MELRIKIKENPEIKTLCELANKVIELTAGNDIVDHITIAGLDKTAIDEGALEMLEAFEVRCPKPKNPKASCPSVEISTPKPTLSS